MPEERWRRLNDALRSSGFPGMSPPPGAAPDVCLSAACAALRAVLTQYEGRSALVEELLAAAETSRRREGKADAAIAELRRFPQLAECETYTAPWQNSGDAHSSSRLPIFLLRTNFKISLLLLYK
jgi:hypothetical protein